jgi:hypothetical protein
MAGVLKHGVVVHTALGEFKTLPAGSVVPKEYADQVTNPKAYVDAETEVAAVKAAAPAPAQTNAGENAPADYSKLKKGELEALAGNRGLDITGTVKILQARLAEADAADAAAAAGDVDISTLDEDGLRAFAAEHGVDLSDATSEEEIRALIENAE